MHVVHLHEKDTHHPKKKRQFVSRWEKKGKKKKISFRDLTCTQQIWGKELKRESCGWYPPQLTPIPTLQAALRILLKAAPGVLQVFCCCVRWAESCSHSELLHQRFHRTCLRRAKRGWVGRGKQGQNPFLPPFSFFSSFLILYMEVRALRQGKSLLCRWGQQRRKYDPQCASE